MPEDIRNTLKEHYISKEELDEKNKIEMKNNKKIKEIDYVESD